MLKWEIKRTSFNWFAGYCWKERNIINFKHFEYSKNAKRHFILAQSSFFGSNRKNTILKKSLLDEEMLNSHVTLPFLIESETRLSCSKNRSKRDQEWVSGLSCDNPRGLEQTYPFSKGHNYSLSPYTHQEGRPSYFVIEISLFI